MGLSFIILPSGSNLMVLMESNHCVLVCVCVWRQTFLTLKSSLPPLSLPEGGSVTSRSGSLASGHFYINYSEEFQKSILRQGQNSLWNSNECTSIPRQYFLQRLHENGFDPFPSRTSCFSSKHFGQCNWGAQLPGFFITEETPFQHRLPKKPKCLVL